MFDHDICTMAGTHFTVGVIEFDHQSYLLSDECTGIYSGHGVTVLTD